MEADTNKINAVQAKDQGSKIQTQKTQEKNGKNQGIFQLLRQRGIEFARRIVYNSFNY